VAEEVFTSPADRLALLKPALEKVTLDECAAALREAFSGNGLYVMVTGNAKISGDAVAAIDAAYEESRVVAVLPKAAEEARAWAYTDFGPPGKVMKREHVADLDLTLVTFANGVRLNLKRTDFDAGRIMVSARVGDGRCWRLPGRHGPQLGRGRCDADRRLLRRHPSGRHCNRPRPALLTKRVDQLCFGVRPLSQVQFRLR
jgi:zinc protease